MSTIHVSLAMAVFKTQKQKLKLVNSFTHSPMDQKRSLMRRSIARQAIILSTWESTIVCLGILVLPEIEILETQISCVTICPGQLQIT